MAARRTRSSAALDGVEVGEHELGLDRLDVAQRVDAAVHVHDVRVLEAAHHLEDRVRLADVGEELVAEALALATRRAPGPAMSTNSTVAGTTRAECTIASSAASRASGTGTTPAFGSIVQNG